MAPPPPFVIPDSGRTIRLGNLDKRVTEDLLLELFIQAGPVLSVVLPKEHTGFAMIEFNSMIDAVYAMVIMNNVPLFGKKMDVYHHYKQQYLLEEQEQMKNQQKFYQAPRSLMKQSLSPDSALMRKALTPEQAVSLGLTQSSDESDGPYNTDDDVTDDDEDFPRSHDDPMEVEPHELPSWMQLRNDVSFSPVSRFNDKYAVASVSEEDMAPQPLSLPPPPPPKPPTLITQQHHRPLAATRHMYGATPMMTPPPPPPPVGGGILRAVSPVTPLTPPRYGNTTRFVAPVTPPSRPGIMRVVSPNQRGRTAPPPPPTQRRNHFPNAYGTLY